MKKYIIIIIIALVVSSVISNIDDVNTKDVDMSSDTLAPSDTSELPEYPGPSEIEGNENGQFTVYYDQLSDFEKKIYAVLEKTVSTAESAVTLSNVNIDNFKNSIERVSIALHYDRPEYFWFKGGYSATWYGDGKNVNITLKPEYYQYVSSIFDDEGKMSELRAAVKNVASLARLHSDDDYERIIFVHDYLVKNAIYDHDALDEALRTSHSPSCEYIFSAYGCLVNAKTVCSGYSKAFQLIMRELGYDATYIVGDAGEPHGWNCIYLEGKGYFIDITWDDFDLENKEIPFYDYAFITNDMLSRTHKIDMEFKAPLCTDVDYNYYVKNGYYIDKYDFNSAAAIISKQLKNDAAYIMFSSKSELDKAVNDLCKSGKISQITGNSAGISYYYNEDFYTLTFILK